MKNLLRLLFIAFTLLTAYAHAEDAPTYQITKEDTKISQLLQRWADDNELGFEWNVSYDFMLDSKVLNIDSLNKELSFATKLQNAVNIVLDAVKNQKPSGRNTVGAELATCYFENEAVLVYTKDQPNCGHVDPSKTTAVDDE